tara:strand:+ start:47 stop:505 length:459 start_codon:yes stop_codon:yes gene_type:complete
MYNALVIIIIFVLDRISKLLIINSTNPLGEINIPVNSFLNFNLIWNEGIAFGLFSFDEKLFYNLLTLFICIIVIIIVRFMLKSNGTEKIGFLMIIGGSLGNIFDRIYYSSVPDFIDLHYDNFHWFIFNVADIFITLGIFLLIILEIFPKKKI